MDRPSLPSEITLELPEPPSGNRWWRMGRSGRRGAGHHMFKSPEARAYQQAVAAQVGTHLRIRGEAVYGPSVPVSVAISWFRARKSGDLDKRLGVLLDALQKTVYAVDSQIVEIHALRFEDPDGEGRVFVIVRPRPEIIAPMRPEAVT